MTFKSFSTILATTALVAFAAPGFAQDKTGLNMDEAATGQPGGVAQFDMAQGLYALSLTNKDALLALTAAKLAAGVQMTDVEREGEQKPADGVTEEADVADAPADAAMMLASAREFAAGDETLLGLIEDIEAEGARGRIGGASRQLSRLPAGAIDVWKIPFYGNSYAEIGISGDGDAPLSVIVTDENGNRVSCPARVYDKFYCDFVPRWNGYFNVSVMNQGSKRNSYYLLTN
ncbi:hypothetical protein EGN72_15940 [Pseudorhodobacter sp. E13]|uniref:hypothetical protein n=1 Tax=Pseudorhodobacter sp. E13 TaxID=2487931 RepID=UPI000F8D2754|nr:hypothetical protein [Pseudorhodobacter sp. E13]RUS59415.1 hypothetical protein EGN72_15940 [Pseudorhodobacter sp. E13]